MQISHVVLLYELGVISEHRDRWRSGLDLRCVVQLHLTSCCLRRLSPSEELTEAFVHLSRRHALPALLLHLHEKVENAGDTLAGYGRGEDKGHEVEIGHLLARLLLISRCRF